MFLVLCSVLLWPAALGAEQLVYDPRHDMTSTSSDHAFHQATAQAAGRNDVRNHHTQTSTASSNSVDVEVLQGKGKQGFSANDAYHVCEFDQTYDYELRGCKRKCNSGETFYKTLDVCVRNEDYKKISNRPLCKNVTVPVQEFDADVSRAIAAKLKNWMLESGSQYTNGTNSVTVCYPFSFQFMTCRRWPLDIDEYELIDNAFRLRVPTYKREYNTEDFFVNDKLQAVVCHRNVSFYADLLEPKVITAYTVACCISAVSLSLTICIIVIKNQWKYHTNVLLCHILSLFAFYTVSVARYSFATAHTSSCEAFAITLHFLFLAAFFWLSVLAYEIWTNLGKLHTNPLHPRAYFLKFSLASAYAWGLSLLICGSAVAVNYLTPPSNAFNPTFAKECWLSKLNNAHILFLYAPAAVIMSANLVFYVLTVLKLRSLGRDSNIVNAQIHKQLLKTYLKLMVVMGVCWTMEVVSGIVGNTYWYWYFTDMINCLQGFFIFLVYFCKRSVLRAIHRAWKKHFGISCFQKGHRREDCHSSSTEVNADSISIGCDVGNNSKYISQTSSSSSSSSSTT